MTRQEHLKCQCLTQKKVVKKGRTHTAMNTFNLELDVPQEDGDIVTELEGKNKITEEDEELLALEKLADEVSEDDVNEDPEGNEDATNEIFEYFEAIKDQRVEVKKRKKNCTD